MTNTLARFDATSLNRALIGFDRLFSNFENRVATQVSNYPPFNVIKTDENNYEIEIAVTGFSKNDITVEVVQEQLIIKAQRAASVDTDREYLHRGLATREFERSFTLLDHMEVKEARVEDGMLRIQVERIIPEAMKPRLIDIK
jgi:molecular chaperone IbpA